MTLPKTFLASGLLLAATAVSAQGVDVSKPIICAATEVVGCETSGNCVRDTPDGFNLPVIFKIDLANKVAESVRAGGEQRSSAIASVADVRGVSILQGTDEAVAWSLVMDQATGRMTVASAHDGIAYSVFGTCVTL